VWLHVLAAATWLGTMVFLAAVLVPVLRATGDDALRARLLGATGTRLRALGWLSFGVLATTGLVNLTFRGFDLLDRSDVGWRLWQGPFGHALAWKLGLFAVVLLLSAVHDFRLGPRATALAPGSPAALRLRRWATWIGRLNLLLGLAIVFLAVALARGGL
jgi:uncharacterized membrane protein